MTTRFLYIVLLISNLHISCQSYKRTQPIDKDLARASQYARDGLLREAIHSYKRAQINNPKNLAIHRSLGILYVKTGDYSKATKHLEHSIKKYQNNFESNFYLAEAYRARDKYGQAIYRYNRSIEIKPNNIKALKALAWSYYKVRFYSEALKITKKLHRHAPGDHQSIIISARTLVKLGRFKKALAILRKGEALAKKGDLPYLKSVEGDIYLKVGKTSKAEATYREALKDQPLLAGALLGLAKCLIKSRKQNLSVAIDYIERAVRLKPRLKEGLYLLGKYYEKNDPSKSKKYYKNFRRYAATDPEFQKELLEIKNHKNRTRKASKKSPK